MIKKAPCEKITEVDKGAVYRCLLRNTMNFAQDSASVSKVTAVISDLMEKVSVYKLHSMIDSKFPKIYNKWAKVNSINYGDS